jgi:hypothetical protein
MPAVRTCGQPTSGGPCVLPHDHNPAMGHVPLAVFAKVRRHLLADTAGRHQQAADQALADWATRTEHATGLSPLAAAFAVMREQYLAASAAGFSRWQATAIVAIMAVWQERLGTGEDEDQPPP